MIIVYYRDKKTGAITRHHNGPLACTAEETVALAKEFNEKNKDKDDVPIAYVHEPDPGSLTEHLLNYLERKHKYTEETIRAALDALEEARDAINSLEVAKE